MSQKRPRSRLGPEEIAKLCDAAAAKGPSFFKYDEATTCAKSRVTPSWLVAGIPVLKKFYEADENLHFVRSDIASGLTLVWTTWNPTWKRPECEKTQYIEVMTYRFMNAFHAISQAKNRKKQTSWMMDLLEGFGVAVETATPAADTEDDSETEYFYGFDNEIGNAYRVKPGGVKDFAVELFLPEDAGDQECLFASFSDGREHELADFTKAQFDALKARRHGIASSGSNEHWNGEHVVTHHTLVVKTRVDRGVLISLFEQQKQILQTPIDWLEPSAWREENKRMLEESDTRKENSPEATAKVVAIMIEIGKNYAANTTAKDDLYKEREIALGMLGARKVNAKAKAKAKAATTAAVEMETKAEAPFTQIDETEPCTQIIDQMTAAKVETTCPATPPEPKKGKGKGKPKGKAKGKAKALGKGAKPVKLETQIDALDTKNDMDFAQTEPSTPTSAADLVTRFSLPSEIELDGLTDDL